jgi:putative ABC transport system permease protein
MTSTLVRLAFSGIRSRILASTLTVLLAGAAAATVVLALEVGDTGRDPWERTFAAAHGAHVLANVPTEEMARSLRSLDGVTESDQPVPQAVVEVEVGNGTEPLLLWGFLGRPRVNTPVRIAGTASPSDGIVLERSFAAALGLDVGARLRMTGPAGDLTLPVVGTAILPSQARYPRSNPGVAWVSLPTLEQLQPDRDQWTWVQALRLADPASAGAVADSVLVGSPTRNVYVQTWEDQRDLALQEAAPLQLILTMYTVVLLAVAFAVVAVLVGARALEQSREIGLLKAVGLTPRQVAAVFVIESVALGLLAAVLGFVAGALLAPRLAGAMAQTTLGSPSVAADPSHVLVAAVLVVAVLVLSAWMSSRRRTRFSVVHALQAGRSAPPTGSLTSALMSRVPMTAPVAVGTSTLLAARSRTLLVMAAITLTGSAFVFALSMQATLDDGPAGEVSDVPVELPVLVYTLDGVLLLIAITALLAIALLSLRERLRDFGVLKAIGLTPRQVASSLVAPYAALAVLAGVLSVPLGIALYVAAYRVAGGDGDPTIAPLPWRLLVPVGTVLMVVAATSVPARIVTRVPTVEVLRYE